MTTTLQALRITTAELDQLTGLEIGSVFMGGMVRPSVLRSPRRLLSLVITEGLVLGVAFILCFGAALLLVRQRAGFDRVGALLLGVAGAIALGAVLWHLYQWRRSKTLGPLARLLDAVDRHNEIIQAVQVMDELAAVQVEAVGLANQAEVMTALQATHDSLISALMTDKILRSHRPLMQRRQALFSTIETSLATLQTLHITHQASEYRQFLQEALAIGLAVQQEMAASGLSSQCGDAAGPEA
jgi:hypothetical protein